MKLFTYADLVVRHYERDKTLLEHSWIGVEQQAHQKARNWFLFVKKHGKFRDRVAFYCVGLPGCLVWLSVKAMVYGGKGRWKIIRGLFRGCVEGVRRGKIKVKRLKLKEGWLFSLDFMFNISIFIIKIKEVKQIKI